MMLLSERIRREAQDERVCPLCMAQREYRMVWRAPKAPWMYEGRTEFVCPCSPPADEVPAPRPPALSGV